ILAAHGTRAAAGQTALTNVLTAVRARLAGVDVRLAYVDVLEPTVGEALSSCDVNAPEPVVVPYLLTAGYHVEVDLPEAVAHAGRGIVTPPLAPSLAVVDALADRLAAALGESGADRAPDHVLLVSAGSTREAVHDVWVGIAADLADRLRTPVTLGALTGAGAVPDQIAQLRAAGAAHIAIVAGLLMPGYFHGTLLTAGADTVAAPLADHPRLIDEIIAAHAAAG
ncbi:sirohydrochlorin chelatase, partial [Kribbia dieselivorans]|uniref:sirohydrochlorin chelatase n=1 Tax=Kribbia dieselivorans TaxID=331526 RepID=UPI0008387E48